MKAPSAQSPFFTFHTFFRKYFLKKNFLSLHTVFILSENIKWLEEFLIYYQHLGFEHFYLYDNEGSSGRINSNYIDQSGNKYLTKYGFKRSAYNKSEDLKKLQHILNKYRDKITYIRWQPRDKKGHIVYSQTEAIEHFSSVYGHENEWVLFLDLDEFLFSPSQANIVDFLKNQEEDVSCIRISQKKFIDRHLSEKKYITQDFQCIEHPDINSEHRPKNLVRCRHINFVMDVHLICVHYNTYVPEMNVFRLNHYHVNDVLLQSLNYFCKKEPYFTLNGVDDGMKRYQTIFDNNYDL